MASKVDRERQIAKKKEIARWCRRWRKRWSETITADNTSKVKKVVKSLLLLRCVKTEANKERQTKIYRKKERKTETERQTGSTFFGHISHLPYPVSHSIPAAAADGNRCRRAPAATSCALVPAPCADYMDDKSLRRSHDNDAWTVQSFQSYACRRGTTASGQQRVTIAV